MFFVEEGFRFWTKRGPLKLRTGHRQFRPGYFWAQSGAKNWIRLGLFFRDFLQLVDPIFEHIFGPVFEPGAQNGAKH